MADVFEQGLEPAMVLMVGIRLGGYEIGGELGTCGMRDVYGPTDTTPEREVAIETLPRTFAQDPEARGTP